MDYSLTTLFVAPVGQTALPSSGSTQDLTSGQLGIFRPDHSLATAGNIAAANWFYFAQGSENTYMVGSKKSDKIKGCPSGSGCRTNVKEWYKVTGCGSPTNQIIDISNFTVKCGEVLTLTLRAFSSYLSTLYFNGLTRSVTVKAPCCDCGADPCTDVDVPTLIDSIITALELTAPGINPDNIGLTKFFTFERIGNDSTAILRITGKALTAYGQPCDVAAFPHEYDRLWFRAFIYNGPATTVDFIVNDSCENVADVATVQTSNYAYGTSAEIKQLEKNFYSTQAGVLKHLFRQNGWNQNFTSYVSDGTVYDTYYIKFDEYDKDTWGAVVPIDETVIIAVPTASAFATALETVLEAGLGTVTADNTCVTTTTTTTTTTSSTTTTTTTSGV